MFMRSIFIYMYINIAIFIHNIMSYHNSARENWFEVTQVLLFLPLAFWPSRQTVTYRWSAWTLLQLLPVPLNRWQTSSSAPPTFWQSSSEEECHQHAYLKSVWTVVHSDAFSYFTWQNRHVLIWDSRCINKCGHSGHPGGCCRGKGTPWIKSWWVTVGLADIDQEDGWGSRPRTLRQNLQVWAKPGFKISEPGTRKYICSNDLLLFIQQMSYTARPWDTAEQELSSNSYLQGALSKDPGNKKVLARWKGSGKVFQAVACVRVQRREARFSRYLKNLRVRKNEDGDAEGARRSPACPLSWRL